MRRCHSHEQLFLSTRQLCEPHGWRVARGKGVRGEESKGSVVLSKGLRSIVVPYRLPMIMDVWEPYVRSYMQADDTRTKAPAPLIEL